jgi:hypothetical protein
VAQLPPLGKQKDNSVPRLPNDSIEGTIWEYTGHLKEAGKEAKDSQQMEGKIRVEGTAIFDVRPTFSLPSKKEVKKVLDKVVEGKGGEVRLPAAPQQNRLGEFSKLSDGRYRLDFKGKEKEDLNGIMIIWKKKGTNGVMLGTFAEREGTKTVRNWEVELRAIED